MFGHAGTAPDRTADAGAGLGLGAPWPSKWEHGNRQHPAWPSAGHRGHHRRVSGRASRSRTPQSPQITACVTLSRWIRVRWLIRGTPVPVINHETRINHADEKREEQAAPETKPAATRGICVRYEGPGPWHTRPIDGSALTLPRLVLADRLSQSRWGLTGLSKRSETPDSLRPIEAGVSHFWGWRGGCDTPGGWRVRDLRGWRRKHRRCLYRLR
jgi:hypothetical protein